jgi:DNA-binding transcriptional MocR family regulator
VSKAYAEAEQRGLISGEVGRGTFVVDRRRGVLNDKSQRQSIDLALNVPPATGAEELVAKTLGEMAADGGAAALFDYLPHQGLREHREPMAAWLADRGIDAIPDRLVITHGAQHAISLAMGLVAPQASIVLTESLTYSGMIALASTAGYRLHGVMMDNEGLLPEALDSAFAETRSRVLYCMPSLQTPTGAVMSEARRDVIAQIVRDHDAYLVEDDTYAFLFESSPHSLTSRLPERSFYVTSFAKCLAPGLRIGAVQTPEQYRDRCINAVRATGWMAVPVMAEVVARLIINGDLDRQVALKRESAARRNEIACQVLGDWITPLSPVAAFHVWLPLPAGRTLTALVAEAARAGITVAPPHALRPNDLSSLGIRLCLGAPASESILESALIKIRQILENAEAISLV